MSQAFICLDKRCRTELANAETRVDFGVAKAPEGWDPWDAARATLVPIDPNRRYRATPWVGLGRFRIGKEKRESTRREKWLPPAAPAVSAAGLRTPGPRLGFTSTVGYA
jgi:hypothetical protein